MAFQIIKENVSDVWRHSFEDGSVEDIILSSGFFKFTGDIFELFSSSTYFKHASTPFRRFKFCEST